jgi:hypothetical protein
MKELVRVFVSVMRRRPPDAKALDLEADTAEAACLGGSSVEFQEALIVMWCFA